MVSALTPEQRELLMEVGRIHLVLESHQNAARFCRSQLRKLRQRLMELEQPLPEPT